MWPNSVPKTKNISDPVEIQWCAVRDTVFDSVLEFGSGTSTISPVFRVRTNPLGTWSRK
jgi:hypothetical protein